MKPLAHAVIFDAVLNVGNYLPKPPGVGIAMHLIEPGAYSIFAASMSAALHDRKAFILLILGLILLLGFPSDTESFARLLVPEGLGIMTGALARRLVTEETVRSDP